MLKTYNEDGANNTIGGIQKMTEAELRNSVIQILLEEYANQGGFGHLNFTAGEVIGTFTDSYWPVNQEESTVRETVTYDFENGAQGWTFDATGFGLQTDTALGTQSIGLDQVDAPLQLAHIEPAELAGGVKVNYVEFSYWESSTSHGGGMMLKDSGGLDVIGVATDNPEWDIVDSTGGTQVNASASYSTWYTVRIFFDWSLGTATVSWYNSTGTLIQSESGRTLINNTNVARLDILNYASGLFQGTTNFHMRFDNIKFEYPVSYVPQTETKDFYQNWSDPGVASVPYALMDYKLGSLAFNGTSDHIDATSPFHSITEGDFTVEMYAYTGGASLSAAYSQGIPSNWTNQLFIFYIGNDTGEGVRVYWDGGSIITLNDDTWFNTWTHFALTRAGDTFTLYQGGAQVATATATTTWTSIAQVIGATNDNGTMKQFYQGRLSDLRVWNYARTQTEIQNNKDVRLAGNESGLVDYRPFDGHRFNRSINTPNVDEVPGYSGTSWSTSGPFNNPKPNSLQELSKEEAIGRIIDLALEELVYYEGPGSFRIFEGTTLPSGATGTWESIGAIVDDQADDASTTYTLWRKTSSGGSGPERPLKWNSNLNALQKLTVGEIQQLVGLLQERMYSTEIGKYAFSVNAPSTGTWIEISSIYDEESVEGTVYYNREYQSSTRTSYSETSYATQSSTTYYGSTFRSPNYYGATVRYETYYGSTFRSPNYYGSTYRRINYYGSTQRTTYENFVGYYAGNTLYYGGYVTYYGSTYRRINYYGSTASYPNYYGATVSYATYYGATASYPNYYGATQSTTTFYGTRIESFYGAYTGYSSETFAGEELEPTMSIINQYRLWLRVA